jgi:hypothetical protein
LKTSGEATSGGVAGDRRSGNDVSTHCVSILSTISFNNLVILTASSGDDMAMVAFAPSMMCF